MFLQFNYLSIVYKYITNIQIHGILGIFNIRLSTVNYMICLWSVISETLASKNYQHSLVLIHSLTHVCNIILSERERERERERETIVIVYLYCIVCGLPNYLALFNTHAQWRAYKRDQLVCISSIIITRPAANIKQRDHKHQLQHCKNILVRKLV